MADEHHSIDTAEQKPGADPRYRFGPTVHAIILRLPVCAHRTQSRDDLPENGR